MRLVQRHLSVILAVMGWATLTACATAKEPASVARPPPPKPQLRLIVLITVDQLRGDLIGRYADRFLPGGFRYLLEQGTRYTTAHYRHGVTETAPGHATLATGADPAMHGIIANAWMNQATGNLVYNTEDNRHQVLGAQPKLHQGVSPRNLLVSTFGDELVLHTAGRSRVFSVSTKDRGAILPAGHAGKAFWFSKRTGQYVTSSYYYDACPAWVTTWNDANPLATRYAGTTWELLNHRSTYLYKDADDRPFEVNLPGFGRTFPHPLGTGKQLARRVSISAMADELTLDFALTLMQEEHLGQSDAPDVLAISFSATDYVGHLFGPDSLESEDTVLRLDRVLAQLFGAIDAQVGLAHTLVVLSADHGVSDAPEVAAGMGLQAGRVPIADVQNPVSNALTARFGRGDLLLAYSPPYLYLNTLATDSAGLPLAEVERVAAEAAEALPAVARAITRSQVVSGAAGQRDELGALVARNWHLTRSGHVHLVLQPHTLLQAAKGAPLTLSTTHGSPWAYDRYVPILVGGHTVPAQTIARPVGPHQIAPTLSAYVGAKPPSAATDELLVEVLGRPSE